MARNDQHITHAATRLREIEIGISKLYLEAAKILSGVTGEASSAEVESLLVSNAGLALEDVRLIKYLSSLPDDVKECLNEASLSIEAAKLLSAAHPDVQNHALGYLRHNKRLDIADVQQLIGRHWQDSLEEKQRAEHDRSKFLERLLAARLSSIETEVEELQTAVLDLADLMNSGADDWQDGEVPEHSLDYNVSFASISALACRILAAVNGIIDKDDLDALELDEATKLRSALTALQRLADGEFAHNGGFGFSVSPPKYLSNELHDAIGYLATADARSIARVPRKRPKVLELLAGAGGSAIGLMGAGFEHVALIEKSRDRADTLKKNWPSWNVIQADIGEGTRNRLSRYRGVDLLAAGLPCAPGDGSEDNPDLFPMMFDALEIIRPRSFMFQYDQGLRQTAEEQDLAGAIVSLERDGEYRVRSFGLDPLNFGLPHSREHGFLVGIRDDVLGVFPDPEALKPVHRGILKVIWPLVSRDRVAKLNNSPEQIKFNHWVDDWERERGEPGKNHFPTVLKKLASTKAWLDAGFNTTEVSERLPYVGDPRIEDGTFVPFITTEVLAVAQGFPSEWKFLADTHGVLGMIADALPPVMAKVVGLAIRSVLEGQLLDLGKALTEQVIDPARIGLGKKQLPNLNGAGRRWPLEHTKGSVALQNKAYRYIAGEHIAVIEPNHKQRSKVREEAMKIHAETDYLMALEREAEEYERSLLPPDE
ncbi:DNA cytosine methyltransferase [Rhizobium johnstonii]|uniref:DNA cytosine methyltransferase n=1 Tax=Rhizobium johnstonii TaxID=3019933 RepID=UPI003F9BC6F4